ncbi:MarR family winged helix-turn-helix transcriptional regulator [Variovorax sp.]|jgi:DNA-binding MarR family transcriptional regulator|uniref:MarR family winged helix-turn-helix transcriptional regulator n=1 Tax=Variovorax sp. TaxID=1871043 RepID=UPI000AC2D9C2|nr:MarR family transcriptional regulator [Variovorax sp.]
MPRQAADAKILLADKNPDHPLIGARLRFVLTQVERRLEAELAAAGHPDILVAHFKVFRFPPPENERPLDLAKRAGTTKQAMNYLLAQLESLGYLERSSGDGTSTRRVSLTAKGWEVARIQRETVRSIERDWEARFGAVKFRAFYEVLSELAGC